MSNKDDKSKKIIQLFGEATAKSGMTAGRDINITIDASTNINKTSRSRPKAVIADGGLTSARKQQLQQLVDAIAKQGGLTHGHVWTQLRRKFKVHSYHALTPDQFPKVHQWLREWYGSASR